MKDVAGDVVRDVVRSPGRSLEPSVRGVLEPEFGTVFGPRVVRELALPSRLGVGSAGDSYEREADAVASRVVDGRPTRGPERVDFGAVRVHSDDRAAESAARLGADAYAVGTHLVFGAGQFAPGTAAGRRLLAHELSHVVQQGAVGPRLQGRWRLDQMVHESHEEPSILHGNADVGGLTVGGVVQSTVRTWQETGFVHQKVGGSGQTARWGRTRYIFRNDGLDTDFLQLRPQMAIAGRAKAEDLYFARSGAVGWGRVTERTATNPTPPDRQLFAPVKGGGVSAATVGDLGTIDAEIPVFGGTVHVTIPLRMVEEGEPAPYSDSATPIIEIPSSVDEVEVVLGGRTSADADIQTAYFGVAPWLSRNFNNASAFVNYFLAFDNRAAPTPRRTETTTGVGVQAATARPDLYRSGNATSPRIDHVRPSDIPVDGAGYVDGPGHGGVSTFADPRREKPWWRYPASKPQPAGIVIRNDHATHWAWEPNGRMKLDDYKARLRAAAPDFVKTW